MATLVSPGVMVTVTDESFYAPAGPGTVPLVIFASAANKLQSGSTTTIAPGTLTSNAGNLYLLTSQRDVITTFGIPNFYDIDGTPQYDNELNEVGLFTLYQYLGIANTAYALRADIDLKQLAPTPMAPTGPVANGSYWLDLTNTSWGIFKSNGNVNSAYAWEAAKPLVITDESNLELVTQGYCNPSITNTTVGVVPNLFSSYNLVINGVSIVFSPNDNIVTVVSKINNNKNVAKLGITATIFTRTGKLTTTTFGDIYNIRLVNSNINGYFDLTGSQPDLLLALGLDVEPVAVVAPASSFGIDGNFAVDTVSIGYYDSTPANRIWQKITLTTVNSTTSWWFLVGSTDTDFPGWGWKAAVPRVITGTVPNPVFNVGDSFVINVSEHTNHTITIPGTPGGTTTIIPVVAAINAALANENVIARAYSIGRLNYLQIINFYGRDTYLNDNELLDGTDHPMLDAGMPTSQTYYSSVTGTTADPTFTAPTFYIKTSSVTNPGTGYLNGDTLTLIGGTKTTTATVTVTAVQVVSAVITAGGTGYAQGDTLTFSGFGGVEPQMSVTPTILRVASVSSGVITGLTIVQAGQYTGIVPTNPVTPDTQTSAHGANATVSFTWGIATTTVANQGNYSVAPTNPNIATGGHGTNASISFTTGYLTYNYFTIDPGTGPVRVVVTSSTLSSVVNGINAAFPNGPMVASQVTVGANHYLQLTNNNSTQFTLLDGCGTPLNTAGIKVGYTFGRQLVYQGYSPAMTVPSDLTQLADTNIWINTSSSDRGVSLKLKRYINGYYVPENITPNIGYIPLYSSDSFANAGFGSTKSVGSIYARYNDYGTSPVEASMMLYQWDGTVWSQLTYTPSLSTPGGLPVNGTYWFNTYLQYDFMVSDGQNWRGYRNVFPATDVAGPILSASQPVSQSTGANLVDSDIWVDTSQQNVFTAYRYDATSAVWRLIDNTDHSTPAGIIFQDARATADGTLTGSTLQSAMLVSDTVDPDAPDAHFYPSRLLLCNTRYSTDNVKRWHSNWFPTKIGDTARWVTASGNAPDGSPYIGSAAQREIIVKSLKSAIASTQDARAEQNFFNLIATPGYVECLSDMVTLNTNKGNVAFIVGDTPSTLDPSGTSIQRWATNANNVADNGPAGLTLANPYVGLYYPWGLGTALDGSSVLIPPSTIALTVIAYNDQVAYPWFPPAGFNRGLVTNASSVGYVKTDGTYQPLILNQGQRDVLYTNNINPIAYIPNRGLVVYGQKTLNPIASALDRINVARLINYLSYYLDNLAKPFLFELNDTQTRKQVVTVFNSFMGSLVSLRAVYDYAVICDKSNNTPMTIDANELWIDVAIKPEKAIEFIYIPIRILNTGAVMPSNSGY